MTGISHIRHMVRSYQWSWCPSHESFVYGTELREARKDDGQGWQQSSCMHAPGKTKVPSQFLKQVRLWRRFLASVPVRDFHLSLQKKCIRVSGKGSRFLSQVPHWQLVATYANRLQGEGLLSLAQEIPCMDFREKSRLIKDLTQAPPMASVQSCSGPVFISGDLLLNFLVPSVRRIFKVGPEVGTWKTQSEWVFSLPNSDPEPGVGDRDSPVFSPIGQGTKIFLPKKWSSSIRPIWTAIDYDNQRFRLICKSTVQDGDYGYVPLGQPLYRFFSKFRFIGAHRKATFHQQTLLMPDVIGAFPGSTGNEA